MRSDNDVLVAKAKAALSTLTTVVDRLFRGLAEKPDSGEIVIRGRAAYFRVSSWKMGDGEWAAQASICRRANWCNWTLGNAEADNREEAEMSACLDAVRNLRRKEATVTPGSGKEGT